ncbi:unnamed protein product [Rhizoctonia solani]|uniref:Uncharacterized protein n=1 Tax=Rhizoctonia solani TaxID=456999 RepID=A0A8H3D3E0_9AGAM|nr:unnamed protein product [Rhizoctonia solani]
MDNLGGGDYSSVPVDFGNLAATIALAADALAAAAEALAEAAGAISDASEALNSGKTPQILSGFTHTTDAPKEPSSGNELEANSQSKSSPGHVDQKDLNNQQISSQCDRGILAPVSPPQSIISISSDSSSEVELRPAEQLSDPCSLENKTSDDLDESCDMFEPELNNKIDAFPPSPVPGPSGVHETGSSEIPTDTLIKGPQSNASQFLEMMGSCPTIPPGRNYIHLDQPSDAFAFIAYMALQVRRIICLVSSHRQEAYAKLLRSLTHAKVHCIDTPRQFDYISMELETPASDILLTPCNNFTMNWRWIQQSNPDCIIHWTQPANIYYCTTGWAVNFLPRTIRACALVVGEQSFDGPMQGVELYPNSVLNKCFQSNSPFQTLRQIAAQLLPAPPVIPSAPPTFKRPSDPLPSQPPTIQTPNILNNPGTASLPVGHYYIVVDRANDTDIIPIIAYIALNTKKVICHVPANDLTRYHTLVTSIANVNVITSGRKAKAPTNRLKSEVRGVLLRSIAREWNSYWAKSLADCVIYCGVPADLGNYLNECNMKVNYSYLVLTRSQYSGIQSQVASYRRFQRHPLIRGSDSLNPGSLLYDLRQKLAPHV